MANEVAIIIGTHFDSKDFLVLKNEMKDNEIWLESKHRMSFFRKHKDEQTLSEDEMVNSAFGRATFTARVLIN